MKLQEALQLIESHSQSAISQIAHPLSRRDVEVSSPAEALRLAFLWRTSREGYNFWRDVHSKLESGIPIPEPVTVLTPEPEPEPEPEPVPVLTPRRDFDCVPYPPVPEGYDRWAERGFGFDSEGRNVLCAVRHPDSTAFTVWGRPYPATGDPEGIYLEAIKDVPEPVPPTSLSAPVPRDLLPLPRVPDGFSHWVYRGTGWATHGRAVCFHCRHVDENTWEGIAPLRCDASGFENLHYIEAVREPLQCEEGRCYVQRDGVVREPLTPTPIDMSGVNEHPFWDGYYYRTPEGYLFVDDSRGSSVYIAEVEPQ